MPAIVVFFICFSLARRYAWVSVPGSVSDSVRAVLLLASALAGDTFRAPSAASWDRRSEVAAPLISAVRLGVVSAKAPLLVRAARTRIREDRLTELLSVVLLGHQAFAHRLLTRANLPALGPVEVSTQVITRRGKRVDMEVLVYDEAGRHPVGRLWSEHKTGSRFSPEQLPGYAEELAEFSGATQLITITDRIDEVEKDPRWEPLTWADVGGMAVELGRAGGRRLWRQDACKTGGASGPRLLHELLSYLEEDRNVVLDPLSHLDIIAFARANHVSAVLTGLLDRAGEYSKYDTDGDAGYYKDDWGRCAIGFSIAGSWPEKLDGGFELQVNDEDDWASERVGEPAFGIGAWLPAKYADPLRGSAAQTWRDRIQANAFSVTVDENQDTRVTKTMYVAEILANGPLLDSQALALARWADDAITMLSTADPGQEPIPDPPKRKKPRKTQEAPGDETDDGKTV